MKLLFVHGRSQQGKDPVQLRAAWVSTLRQGFAKHGLELDDAVDVALPFYGDRLDELAREADVPLSADIVAKGGDVDQDYLDFRASMLEEVRQAANVTDAEVDREYGPNAKSKGLQNWEWVQAVLRAVEKRVPAVADWSIERFLRDVYLYLRAAGVRHEVDTLVATAITNDTTVVVGHSLGSVVAYNLLRATPSMDVPLFVTVGSPLGIVTIRNDLRPLRHPSSVRRWYNAFDERDVVALHALDAARFPVAPAIVNYNKVKNDTANRHGISGYLNDAAVAREIHNALA